MWAGADPLSQASRHAAVMADTELTERQRAAAVLIARGHTNRDVARELRVSLRTVEGERSQLMRKLGLRRRSELVRWGLQRGLLY